MKRYLWLTVVMVFLLCAAACQKKEKGPEGTERTKFVPEDYNPTNSSLLKTEKGIYYYNETQKALRYFDFASERDIYLCNKPECKHDGNAFCVATNARYSHLKHFLYNGKIVAPALEETDTQYLMKLLVFSLDGAQMEDYATMLSIERTEGLTKVEILDAQLHRNKMLVSFMLYGDKDLEDSDYMGAFFYDLDTSETTSLNEELFSKENPAIQEIKAQGDYFYYYRQVNKKRRELYRYHIVNKMEEECTPEVGFRGNYFFLGDDQLFYRRGDAGLGFYRISTKELMRTLFNKDEMMKQFEQERDDNHSWVWLRLNHLQFIVSGNLLSMKAEKRLKKEPWVRPHVMQMIVAMKKYFFIQFNKEEYQKWGSWENGSPKWLGTDDQYIYHIDSTMSFVFVSEIEGEFRYERKGMIPLEIYDLDGTYRTTVNLMDAFAETDYFDDDAEGYKNIANKMALHFDGADVFYVLHRKETDAEGIREYDRIYRLNRQEMLDGTAKAEFICDLRVR